MRTIIALTASLAIILGGCASITQDRIDLVYSRCPVLMQYTQEEMKAAAEELEKLPTESQIAEMITDYSKLRDACRLAERALDNQR
jgi:hypothetical protein